MGSYMEEILNHFDFEKDIKNQDKVFARLDDLKKEVEAFGISKSYESWNYTVRIKDYEDRYHDDIKVSMVCSLSLLRDYAKVLLASKDFRYTDVEIHLGDRLVYKDFRYDKHY